MFKLSRGENYIRRGRMNWEQGKHKQSLEYFKKAERYFISERCDRKELELKYRSKLGVGKLYYILGNRELGIKYTLWACKINYMYKLGDYEGERHLGHMLKSIPIQNEIHRELVEIFHNQSKYPLGENKKVKKTWWNQYNNMCRGIGKLVVSNELEKDGFKISKEIKQNAKKLIDDKPWFINSEVSYAFE